MRHHWIWVLGMGALLMASAPAQVIFSFEDPNMHGYAGDGDPDDYCQAVGYDNCWQIFQATTGVTDGSYSMGIRWPGGFRWLISDGNPSIVPLVRQSGGKYLVDVTAARSVPWSNFIVSYNDGQYGWRQAALQATLPRTPSSMTVLIDASALTPPVESAEWFQIGLGINAGGAHEVYIDNLRLYDDSKTRLAITFDNDLQGFYSECATVTHNNGAMQVSWGGGFCWLFGGTADGFAALLNRGHILVMDVTVPPGSSTPWSNMIISLNHAGGWNQTANPIELPTGPGTYTVAVDYRDLNLPDPSGWVTLNLGINAGSAHNLIIDNIRVLVEPVAGDVNGDGCVDDADLLAVLFAFGCGSDCGPEDVNGDGVVDDADLLAVLFAFGNGC